MEHPPVPHAPMASEPERAARKMEVDEDYDDDGDDEKKPGIVPGPTSGSGPATAPEMKNGTPTTTTMNGN